MFKLITPRLAGMPLGLTLGGVADGEGCLKRLCGAARLGATFLAGEGFACRS